MPARLEGSIALVTGASSGIGAATALALARAGASVALVARRVDRIEELRASIEDEGGEALACAADVADAHDASRVVDAVVEHCGRLDILVNNAGLMYLGPVEEAPLSEWHEMVDVNITGLLNVTHAALPHLLAAARTNRRGVADLVNVSSVGGRRASAGTAVYNATKFAVGAFTEALRQEVTKQHVRVAAIEPGMVATEVLDRSRPGALDAVLERFGREPGEVERLTADDVADAIAYMVTRPRHVAISELMMRPTEQV